MTVKCLDKSAIKNIHTMGFDGNHKRFHFSMICHTRYFGPRRFSGEKRFCPTEPTALRGLPWLKGPFTVEGQPLQRCGARRLRGQQPHRQEVVGSMPQPPGGLSSSVWRLHVLPRGHMGVHWFQTAKPLLPCP